MGSDLLETQADGRPGGSTGDAGEPLLRFIHVDKSYDGDTLIIRQLNLDVFRGEFLTLLGPSGSGKTTCLMMVAGFEPVTAGELILDGRPINRLPPHKRGIGVVFQNYALFPHMTVAENVAFPLEARGVPRREIGGRIKQVLEMVRLGNLGLRRPHQLSGGQQQRVALARALVFEPQIVLMDEPLGALDKQLREQMQYEIKQLHEKLGVTMLYVTHDQNEALTMSDRIAVFNNGIIEQVASPIDLYEQPTNSFVARFVGENNTLEGSIKATDGKRCEVVVDGGWTVQALAVRDGGVGSRTLLSLRPERVQVKPPRGALPNEFEGVVEEVIFHGDHVRVRARVCDRDFIVKIPNSRDRVSPERGETVRVGWASEDCRALDEAQGDREVTGDTWKPIGRAR